MIWTLRLYAKPIIQILILSVPDEGYSRNVPDEGYSRNVPDEGIPETRRVQ